MKYLVILILLSSCMKSKKEEKKQLVEERIKVEIATTKGDILVELYNETPLHRDNFLKLVKENFYDSLLFHRVIDNFIIQTGDPDSFDAQPGQQLGYGDLDYLVPSEIIDTIFHKRGSLSAAHDGNPDFYSSASQFVIVQEGPVPDSSFSKMENWINKNLDLYNFFHADSNSSLYNTVQKAYEEHDWELYGQLYDSVRNIRASEENLDLYQIPEEHKAYYRKYGGTPFNDRLFTVFGEVLTGMNVVDSIAKVETDKNDRPMQDVRIISMQVVN
ncbi:peptidylprolyl isomerase [Flagellimonas zhangzhouensis]|nr:peptidylprolyl isomerase [Allomuricauda zhangzhouensis]